MLGQITAENIGIFFDTAYLLHVVVAISVVVVVALGDSFKAGE